MTERSLLSISICSLWDGLLSVVTRQPNQHSVIRPIPIILSFFIFLLNSEVSWYVVP